MTDLTLNRKHEDSVFIDLLQNDEISLYNAPHGSPLFFTIIGWIDRQLFIHFNAESKAQYPFLNLNLRDVIVNQF